MAELLKNIYNESFFERLTQSLINVYPSFHSEAFLKKIYDSEWETRELKQRMRHITVELQNHLTGEYPNDLSILLKLRPELESRGVKPDNLEFIILPDYVEIFGIDYPEISIAAIEQITQFVSCEFGIRPFLLKYPKETIQQMLAWSKHEHASVRRLASEGCRPRLPWAMGLPFLKIDPSPILPILENLKSDDSEYVRRSVANNLNDISKDHPELVIEVVKKWKDKSIEIDQLVKHASRTLLKQGNAELMSLFGFGGIESLTIKNFKISTPKVKIGDSAQFSFDLKNSSSKDQKIRVEYGLYFQKANGTLSKKVFKISEKIYSGNSTTTIDRKQHFKIITTRKYHTGLHQVALILNGVELDILDFSLIQ